MAMTDNNDNKRKNIRRRTIFGGIIYEDTGQATECSITDISETGVKVRTKMSLEIGREVDLKINKFNELRRCVVAWVREGEVGLQFLIAMTAKNEEMARLFKFSKPTR